MKLNNIFYIDKYFYYAHKKYNLLEIIFLKSILK